MSGECEDCGEHCLECTCVSPREKWLCLPYEMRLFLAEYIFKAITQEPGCSFRRLIYNRLEFEPRSYCDLYYAGGMLITNAMCDQDHLDHNGIEIKKKFEIKEPPVDSQENLSN